MDTTFLPGYEVPKPPSQYMKFEQGANKFRILMSPIVGYSAWTKDDKHIRTKTEKEIPLDKIKEDRKVKHFWAMPVWNYNEKRVQILELEQVGIQKKIKGLANNDDWGSPLGYDITVTREGEKLKTDYEVQPSPKSDPSLEISEAWAEVKNKGFDITKLYTGENPFGDGSIVQVADDTPTDE